MPELTVTDEQLERLRAICEELEAFYVGEYGRVDEVDAVEYLLDSYRPPEEMPTALTDLEGVGDSKARRLREAGYESVDDVRAATVAELTQIDGIGDGHAAQLLEEAGATGAGRSADTDDTSDDDADSTQSDGTQRTDADRPSAEVDGADDTTDGGAGSAAPAAAESGETLQQAMSMLDTHDDRWREHSGDEPYEVDLPDGSTESARTKDDVRRLLFKHWR
ncbi:MAG: helix-hairpin-helix domain-containing protein [Natronomonas sp.]